MVRNAVVWVVWVALIAPLGWAQEPTEAATRPLSFGAGMHFTAVQNGEFPTGVSARLWVFNQYGLEVDVFTRESNPTITLRTFYKLFDTGLVSLLAGGGVAFFSNGLSFDSTLQGAVGLEVSLGSNLVFGTEVGALLGSSVAVPVTAGAGIYYYF